MLNITNYYRNANQTVMRYITSQWSEWSSSKNLQMLERVWKEGNAPTLLLEM